MLTFAFDYIQVEVMVFPTQEASRLGELAQSLIFPVVLFAGIFGAGGFGCQNNPMGFGKSKADTQMDVRSLVESFWTDLLVPAKLFLPRL
jgi:hypothetical protein